uniref:Radical SAM core domain-containing protein n=1 Tax=Candidatus Nitrotoga fabula TaxID=2182327 RepID=A0A2X0QUH9_9PROT|nr:protein of unknown function [Candidatus Nitrotoga fabula]
MIHSISRNEDSPCVFRGINQDKLTIVWEITARCNLKCGYCFRTDPRLPELRLNQVENIVEQFSAERVGKVLLTGGEPILYPNVGQIIDRIISKGILVKIVSNLSFSHRWIEVLIDKKGIEISTSLDGYDAKTHDQIRGRDSYKRVSENILILRRNGFDVSGICVVTTQVLPFIETMVQNAVDLGLSTITFTRLIDIKAEGSQNISEVVAKLELTNDDELRVIESLELLREKYWSINIRSVGFTVTPECCSKAGKGIVYINPYGIVQPCTLLRFINKNIDLKLCSLEDALSEVKFIKGETCESYCRSLPVSKTGVSYE